jgi:hypothetical protein
LVDNGFGAKATSADLLLRAYHLEIDFKTADGGTGDVEVRDFISFRDPNYKLGFPIVNEHTDERYLTGFDLTRVPPATTRATCGWERSSGRGSSTSIALASSSRRRTAST